MSESHEEDVRREADEFVEASKDEGDLRHAVALLTRWAALKIVEKLK